MRIKPHTILSVFAGICAAAGTARAAVSQMSNGTSVRPVSQYGLIQNVQNYSTNPFWTADSPYNQKFPQAVYVSGPELTSADCQSTVGTLVASYCSSNNNCSGMQLSDVRPIMMLQLSRLPGHNYASACAGYIDSEFDSYVTKYSAALPNGRVNFPGGTVANPDYNKSEFKLENPYERRDGTWNGEEWQREKKERANELENLLAENGGDGTGLNRDSFPTTFADLSFSDQLDAKAAGYEPYKNSSAYRQIKVEDEDAYMERQKKRLEEYCRKTNDDFEKCPTQYCKVHTNEFDKCPEQYCKTHSSDYDHCPVEYCKTHEDSRCPQKTVNSTYYFGGGQQNGIDCTRPENANKPECQKQGGEGVNDGVIELKLD